MSPNCACGSLCMHSCLLDGPVDTEDCYLYFCDMTCCHSYEGVACEDAALSSDVCIASTASLVALWVATMTIFGIVTAALCCKIHKLKQTGKQTIM